MNIKLPASLIAISFTSSGLLVAQDAEKITYVDHIKPMLENKCFSCHNPDKKKGDLDLTSFGGVMNGGGGGAVVEAGNSGGSRMVTTTKKAEEPFMPPEGSPLSAADIALMSKWIDGGLLETKSSLAKKSNKPKLDLNVAVGAGKPEGPIARPEHVLLEPVVVTPRTTAVTAMAASPWTNLVAIAAPKQVLLYDTESQQLVGIFPYTEGYARTLKFSSSGALLVMGGGRGGKFGHAIVWDVKTGKRITEIGKEMDCVMSADISADHSKVVIGTPSKKVKVYDINSGEELYVIGKHTEWVLATKFSPDGVLLASADRNGNVNVWEAANGGEYFGLGQHKASCTDLAWRADGNLLASCSEDGTIILWEMNEGKQVKSWAAHGNGVQSVAFTPDGKVLSSGRDGQVKLWDANGNKLAESPSQGDVVTKVVALSDSKGAVSANWRGELKILNLENKFAEKGALTSNPSPIAQRILETEKRVAELTAQIPAVEAEAKAAQDAVTAKERQLADQKKQFADAEAYRKKLDEDIKGYPAKLAELDKQLADAKTKRQGQVDAIKKHEQTTAQVKEKETALAKVEAELKTLEGEVAKFAKPEEAPQKAEAEKKVGEKKTVVEAQRAALAPLKQAIATAPKPVAEFDKVIKDVQDLIAKINTEKQGRPKELENAKKAVEAWPKNIAETEKQLGEVRNGVAPAQKKVADHKELIAVLQKQPTLLRAAQFNLGLLVEKDKLAQLEGEVTGYQDAVKDSEETKTSSATQIEASKKAIAEANAAIPGLEAALAKVQGELPGVEKIIDPTKAQEGMLAAEEAKHKTALTAKEAELKGFEQEKAARVAAAQKAVEDISKQIDALNKQLNDVNGKFAGPQKQSDEKKAVFTKAEGELKAAQEQHAAATKAQQTKTAEKKAKDAALATAHQATETAQKAVPPVSKARQDADAALVLKKGELAQKEKDLAAVTQSNNADQIASTQKQVNDLKTAVAAATKKAADAAGAVAALEQAVKVKQNDEAAAKAAHETASKATTDAEKAIATAANIVKEKETRMRATRTEFENAEKIAAPLRTQQQNVAAQIEKQKATRAEKQAEPGNAEKDFAAKAQPVQAAIAQIKGALEPVEKQLGEVRAKLAADMKVVEVKRAEVGKAMADVATQKKRVTDSQTAIEKATKAIADGEKTIAESKAALTKLEPQLPPLRDKVKHLTDQYLAMLPK
jgi:WD40 repeat protein/chromosome segregation ATPase